MNQLHNNRYNFKRFDNEGRLKMVRLLIKEVPLIKFLESSTKEQKPNLSVPTKDLTTNILKNKRIH